ncbi:MAG: AAA family ATPase [Candidatus Atribacteria bacterium]|nr:AAA family ATPase [Candidatus Atribacteria bacterium]MCD6350336.1 AAA family ATPase [Candidatus Atribacteria bacterium]
MSRLTITNQKGGVGKTTIAANLGASLAMRGGKVLLADLDQQSGLTVSLGLDRELCFSAIFECGVEYFNF